MLLIVNGFSMLCAKRALFFAVPLRRLALKTPGGAPMTLWLLRGVPVDENLKSCGTRTDPRPPPTLSPSRSRSSKRATEAIA